MKVEMKVVTMRPKGVHELIAKPWCLLWVYLNTPPYTDGGLLDVKGGEETVMLVAGNGFGK